MKASEEKGKSPERKGSDGGVDTLALLNINVDEPLIEQLDKVAMFFNAKRPGGKNGECESIYKLLPNVDVLPSENETTVLGQLEGPEDEDVVCIGHYAACRTISSYPMIAGTNLREGDPICDRYYVKVYPRRAIIVVADGCNWGVRPREAAIKATTAFVQYLESRHKIITDLPELGHCVLRAFATAHEAIIKGKEDIWEAGTTTLLGGCLVQLRNSSDGRARWSFVCGSVGDCKAFHYSRKHNAITDITEMNRLVSNSVDAKDPGGRIGPYVGSEGHPDLRNLALFHLIVREDDLLFILSDGVHDNMDPAQLGRQPGDLTANPPAKTWSELRLVDAERLKTRFRNIFLRSVIQQADYDPRRIVDALVTHAWRTTVASREFMEVNIGKKQPADCAKYPGKMDHATALCLRVAKYGEVLRAAASSSLSS